MHDANALSGHVSKANLRKIEVNFLRVPFAHMHTTQWQDSCYNQSIVSTGGRLDPVTQPSEVLLKCLP